MEASKRDRSVGVTSYTSTWGSRALRLVLSTEKGSCTRREGETKPKSSAAHAQRKIKETRGQIERERTKRWNVFEDARRLSTHTHRQDQRNPFSLIGREDGRDEWLDAFVDIKGRLPCWRIVLRSRVQHAARAIPAASRQAKEALHWKARAGFSFHSIRVLKHSGQREPVCSLFCLPSRDHRGNRRDCTDFLRRNWTFFSL